MNKKAENVRPLGNRLLAISRVEDTSLIAPRNMENTTTQLGRLYEHVTMSRSLAFYMSLSVNILRDSCLLHAQNVGLAGIYSCEGGEQGAPGSGLTSVRNAASPSGGPAPPFGTPVYSSTFFESLTRGPRAGRVHTCSESRLNPQGNHVDMPMLDTALNAVVCRAGIRALGQLELGARALSRGRITPNYTVCVKPTSACYEKKINRSETRDKKQPQTHRRCRGSRGGVEGRPDLGGDAAMAGGGEGRTGGRKGAQREACVCSGGSGEMRHSFTATPGARKVHFMMIITFWPGREKLNPVQDTARSAAILRPLTEFRKI
ncbi:hypothetical protein NQ318_011605 [Aromia moschata]|uniref:Uncharacterized protein n=1 Tax=Aromia moschata TaxID=1265417 RepID=A0AAV8Z8W0_9CUCU|nr:hypothetical protein NQ318_011605 [Aromia moschata]